MKTGTLNFALLWLVIGVAQITGCEAPSHRADAEHQSTAANAATRPHTYTWPPGRPIPAGAELRIEPENEVIRVGDAAVIRAVVSYRGAGQLRFRLLLPEMNFEITVTDETGHAVPLTRFGQRMAEWKELGMPMTMRGDIPLDTGESVTEWVTVSRHFDLTLPGKYAIVMERDLRPTDDDYGWAGSGRIRSNAIVIEVKRPLPERFERSTTLTKVPR